MFTSESCIRHRYTVRVKHIGFEKQLLNSRFSTKIQTNSKVLAPLTAVESNCGYCLERELTDMESVSIFQMIPQDI